LRARLTVKRNQELASATKIDQLLGRVADKLDTLEARRLAA